QVQRAARAVSDVGVNVFERFRNPCFVFSLRNRQHGFKALDAQGAQVFELLLRLVYDLFEFGRRFHDDRRLTMQSRIRLAASLFESVGSSSGSLFRAVSMV